MMYGFGDDENPYSESVELLEDLVIQYIQNMVKILKDRLQI
jgi:transcription initiation factor TFIID subunit 13